MNTTLDERRSTTTTAGLLAIAVLLATLAILAVTRRTAPDASAGRSASETAAAPSGVSAGTADHDAGQTTETQLGAAPISAADPSGVRIPVIGVDAATIPLGLRSDGSIDVPKDFDQTGWWADGPEPGEPGPAVVLGHVDSVNGPAVFSRLGELDVGDIVHIDREDGTTVSYQVDRVEQHPKDDFPTDAVYGRQHDESVLRLVTCGGTFDRKHRSYIDNVIVFASLITSP